MIGEACGEVCRVFKTTIFDFVSILFFFGDVVRAGQSHEFIRWIEGLKQIRMETCAERFDEFPSFNPEKQSRSCDYQIVYYCCGVTLINKVVDLF